MANYQIGLTDNGDGSFTLTSCTRGSSGGLSLLPTRSGGDAVTKQFGWTGVNGGFIGQPSQVVQQAVIMIAADRSVLSNSGVS